MGFIIICFSHNIAYHKLIVYGLCLSVHKALNHEVDTHMKLWFKVKHVHRTSQRMRVDCCVYLII